MRVLRHAAGVAVVLMAAAPGAAAAQSNDPPQGSPSGKVYEIPLDDARRDAAPAGGGPGGKTQPGRTESSTGRGKGAIPSPIRSENNFGSSSTVPGAAPAAADRSDPDDDTGAGTTDDTGAGRTEGGGAGATKGGGAPDRNAAGRLLAASDAGAATPSKTRGYLLLLLALGAALGLGVASRYLARGR